MLIVDLIAGAVIAGAVVWGFARGVERTLPFAGFGVGAVLGTRLPLLLGGDLHSDFSLVAALPAALVLGGLFAAVVERWGPSLGRRRRRGRSPWRHGRSAASAVGGALLAGGVAVVAVWALGPVAKQIPSVRDQVGDSSVLARLNSVLTPAGPEPGEKTPPAVDILPVAEGPPPSVPPPDVRAETDPDVKAAERSVVKIGVLHCGESGQGSGWVIADGIVVTNAHVAASADTLTARSRGTGPARAATAVWFDPVNDFALLRVPKLKGVPALPMVRRPRGGTTGASLGFPKGIRTIRRARLGPTTSRRRGELGGKLAGPDFSSKLYGRLVTTFRGKVQPGSSGGPVVDTRGRVLTTVFAGAAFTASGIGVPNRLVRAALPRAGKAVSTGRCLNDSDPQR